jgi:hypothetical protein
LSSGGIQGLAVKTQLGIDLHWMRKDGSLRRYSTVGGRAMWRKPALQNVSYHL